MARRKKIRLAPKYAFSARSQGVLMKKVAAHIGLPIGDDRWWIRDCGFVLLNKLGGKPIIWVECGKNDDGTWHVVEASCSPISSELCAWDWKRV